MKYRIVTDRFCGYEVQIKRWWFPVWLEIWGQGANTWSSLTSAELAIERHSNKKPRYGEVVKEIEL